MPSNFLNSISEFSSIHRVDLDKFESKAKYATFTKNTVLFNEGDKAEYVWFLVEGRVALGSYSKKGGLSAVCSLSKGDIFCCLPALDEKPYPASAVSQIKSTVLKVPMVVFRNFLNKHPDIFQKLVIRFCNNWRQMECQLCKRSEDAQTRIAMSLVDLEKKYGNQIPLTRSEIANLSGITIETTIRITSALKKQGVLGNSRRGVIAIKDLNKLKQLYL